MTVWPTKSERAYWKTGEQRVIKDRRSCARPGMPRRVADLQKEVEKMSFQALSALAIRHEDVA